DYDGRPLLLHNERPSHNHWIGVNLVGTRSNRDGYGARVTVTASGLRLFADCTAAGSYLSSMDPRVHFGLGRTALLKSVTVRWPSGRVTSVKGVPVDRYVTIREDQT
ncbi:MAG: ASPIC/UnbV domain-containing protein, partial [Chloroflexi bacterium]|nr:ASPIC/UnbV domain-containing protein [Chloroflexota bacterium]